MKKILDCLVITIILLSFSIGLFCGMWIMSDRIESKQKHAEEINYMEINAAEILSEYYGNAIKKLDKIPADSLDKIIKESGY